MGAIELMKRLLEGSKDHAFVFMDPDGVVTDWLGASEETFGFAAHEVVGKRLSTIFTPEDMQKRFDRYELEVARADSRSEDDRWHIRKDHTRIWVTGTVNAIRDENGQLLGFVKIMRDRTDQRSQIELLEGAAAALRESRERTHLFLRTLGHELRNPLSPLKTATHLIARLSPDPKVDGAVQIILRQIEVLTRLADDLMDVARLETGKVAVNLQPADLRLLLTDAVTSMQKMAADKGLKLVSVLPEGSLDVKIDQGRFQRLVLNLLVNAIKYTPAGGSIWVKATMEGPEVALRVEDTGIGIAPEILPRIFELFTRERSASQMAPGGLGVGLAMVREIAELHGGNVQARSAGAGKGAEFTVRLPAWRPGQP
jgi:PAS domain S-box-containing protein